MSTFNHCINNIKNLLILVLCTEGLSWVNIRLLSLSLSLLLSLLLNYKLYLERKPRQPLLLINGFMRVLLVEVKFGDAGFNGDKKKLEKLVKNPWRKVGHNNKLNQNQNQTRAIMVGGKCSHHCIFPPSHERNAQKRALFTICTYLLLKGDSSRLQFVQNKMRYFFGSG